MHTTKILFLLLFGNLFTVFSAGRLDYSSLNHSIDSLMTHYHLPGLQLAIIYNDEIVYNQSFGWADEDAGIPVSDTTLFRIASISKPITMAAILKLANENKIAMDQLVFGENGILADDYSIPDNDRIKQITVRHLIDHKSGWVNEPGDPMFQNAYMNKKQLIQYVLSSRIPKYVPGEQYDYSNFGYCVLGRVIEKITGIDYETYVRKEILNPCGITDMYIGKDTYDERHANEAAYYSTENTGAYMMPVNRMDAHGGWIASAADLVKFLMHVDRNPAVADILPPNLMQNTYFSYEKWYHSGSLPGTTTLLARQNNKYGYAFLTNIRLSGKDTLIESIQKLMDSFLRENE